VKVIFTKTYNRTKKNSSFFRKYVKMIEMLW